MVKLKRMKWLFLSQNGLSHRLLETLENLDSPKGLQLTGKDLEGKVPEGLDGLSRLTYLILADRLLSGKISPDIPELPNLKLCQAVNTNFDIGVLVGMGSERPNIVMFQYGGKIIDYTERECQWGILIKEENQIANTLFEDLNN